MPVNDIFKSPRTRAVAIVSGGLDSVTMLYEHAKDENSELDIIHALSFNYGQRHKKELDYAQLAAEQLHIPWSLIDLWSSGLPDLLASSESSLVSNAEVPEGHYAEESMKATVVPNRNMMMLSIAGAVAVAKMAPLTMIGVHAGDHFVYPDCRPAFIASASTTFKLGNVGFGPFQGQTQDDHFKYIGGYYAPFLHSSKADIAYAAIQNGVPLNETWSCYKGEAIHCGRCGTCVERLEAIDAACTRIGIHDTTEIDKTEYADTEFWKQAVANA